MPALDRAYRAGPVPNDGFDEALRLAVSYGDSSTKALWRGRSAPNRTTRNIWLFASRSARDSVDGDLRALAERACARPSGRYPLAQPVSDWRRRCELYRSVAYGAMSAQSLRDGRARLALSEADSAIAAMRRNEMCQSSRGYFDHALASLALGDTAAAERDFALGSASHPPGTARRIDIVRAHLGARFDQARYLARTDSAYRVARACQAAATERTKERERRSGS